MINLGRLLGKKEPAKFEKAEEYIMKGIKMSDEMNLRPFISHGHFYLGDLLYNDMGRKDEALIAEGMYQEMGMDYYLDKTQKLLERIQ